MNRGGPHQGTISIPDSAMTWGSGSRAGATISGQKQERDYPGISLAFAKCDFTPRCCAWNAEPREFSALAVFASRALRNRVGSVAQG